MAHIYDVLGISTFDRCTGSARCKLVLNLAKRAGVLVLFLLSVVSAHAQHSVTLTWSDSLPPDSANIYRNGAAIATLPGTILTFTDSAVADGTYTYGVSNVYAGSETSITSSTAVVSSAPPPPPPQGTAEMINAIAPVTFSGAAGATIPCKTITVSDTSPITAVTNVAASSSGWLSVTPTSGSTYPGNESVCAKTTGLAAGTYTGTISVLVPNQTVGGKAYTWTNSPLAVPVTLTITGSTPPPPPPPPPTPTFTHSCAWVSGTGTTRTWRCDTVTVNVPSGTVLKDEVTVGTLPSDIKNGVRP